MPVFVVFCGLPGTGKTTLARGLAVATGALYLRIDSIEHALRNSGEMRELGGAGYMAAYAVAADNLRLGLDVLADSVNPVEMTRTAWREVAHRASAKVWEVEVVCSDQTEHRRRVEYRVSDLDGFRLPTWEEVVMREYQPADGFALRLDTAGKREEESLAELLAAYAAWRA